MDEAKMNKKPFFDRLIEIYWKTYKEPDWNKILKKTKKEKKNETDTTKI
jgi:hypothetical protein